MRRSKIKRKTLQHPTCASINEQYWKQSDVQLHTILRRPLT